MKKQGTDHLSNLPRIKKIEGQIRGISKMIEDKRYCVDILTQIKAARASLKSLETQILEEHLNHCLLEAVSSGNSKESKEMINELLILVKKSST